MTTELILKEPLLTNSQQLAKACQYVELVDTAEVIPGVKFAHGQEKALYMPAKNKVLGLVSKSYKLVSNREVFMPIYDELCTKYGEANIQAKVFNIDDVKHYATFEVLDRPLVVQKGDLLNPAVSITNSYDGSLRFGVNIGIHRLICANGLKAFEQHISYTKRHTQGLEIPFDLVHDNIDKFPSFREHIQRLTDRQLSHKEILELEEAVKGNTDFPKRFFSDVPLLIHKESERLDVPISAWQVYNGYNHVLSHAPLKMPPEQRAKIDLQVLQQVELFLN